MNFLSLPSGDRFNVFWELLTRPTGLIELALVIGAIYIGYGCSRLVFRRYFQGYPERYDRLVPYLLSRMVLPFSSFLLTAFGAFFWDDVLKLPHFIFVLGSVALLWLAVIRIAVAVLRFILPFKKQIERSSEQFVALLLWGGFVTYVLGFSALVSDTLESVTFNVGKTKLNLMLIGNAVLWSVLIIVVALWIGRVLDKRLMKLSHMDMNLRIVLSKVVRSVVLVLAVLITLSMLGIDLTVLSVFGGAVGVGLGLGLQKVASNYISGFIILLDHSIRIGDRVTIDNRTGYIHQITSRYVVLKGTDGTEALIPNDTLISNTVVNQSYTDTKIWQSISVGVAYDTDLDQALALLLTAAAQAPRVLTDPAPSSYVTDFGASSITLTVGFWLGDPENGLLSARSELNLAIWRAFKAHGIQMPFPQQEVRVLNAAAFRGETPQV